MEGLLGVKDLNGISNARHALPLDKGRETSLAISGDGIGFPFTRMMPIDDFTGLLAGTIFHIPDQSRTIGPT